MIFGNGGMFNGGDKPLLVSKQSVSVALLTASSPQTVSITPVDVDKALIINNGPTSFNASVKPEILLKTIVGGKYTEVEIKTTDNSTLYFDVVEFNGLKSIQHITINPGNNTITAVDPDKSIILDRGGRNQGSTVIYEGLYLSSGTNLHWDNPASGWDKYVTVAEFI